MPKPTKPKKGQSWRRRSTGAAVLVLAVVNPQGDPQPYVVVEGARVTTVRLDRFHRDYELLS